MVVDLGLLFGDSGKPIAEKLEQAMMSECLRQPLNVISEDAYGCCARIRKAVQEKPDMERWDCPGCGLNWMPRLVDGIRLWEAKPAFQVWKRR